MRRIFLLSTFLMIVFPSFVFAQEALPVGRISREDLNKFRQIPPEQRRDAINQVQGKWQSLSLRDKNALKEQVKSDFYSKSPAEQKQLEKEALAQWNAMSREEQNQLKAAFPELEGEDLVPRTERR